MEPVEIVQKSKAGFVATLRQETANARHDKAMKERYERLQQRWSEYLSRDDHKYKVGEKRKNSDT